MLWCGTTTCEAKSGYGLTTDAELKMLRVIAAVARDTRWSCPPPSWAAHECPRNIAAGRRGYIDLLIGEMIPLVARERLAEWCDVFCETGVFTPAEAREISRRRAAPASSSAFMPTSSRPAAVRASPPTSLCGLPITSSSSMSMRPVGSRPQASSRRSCRRRRSNLKLGRFAPGRMLIARGVPVSARQRRESGGGFSPSMSFAMTLGLLRDGADVRRGAGRRDHQRRIFAGSARPPRKPRVGKQMDAVIVDGPAIDLIGSARTRLAPS